MYEIDIMSYAENGYGISFALVMCSDDTLNISSMSHLVDHVVLIGFRRPLFCVNIRFLFEEFLIILAYELLFKLIIESLCIKTWLLTIQFIVVSIVVESFS